MKIVNVASVPQRSPFRYPGGKTWLVPFVRRWLKSVGQRPSLLIEPFAGGGTVGLTAAFEQLADRVLLVELDNDVAAVWKTILGGQAKWLAERILDFDVTMDRVKEALAAPATSTRHRAFQTILRNRMYHGGIMAPGSGLIKHGENGKGLKSRWYPATLSRRIRDIAEIRARIDFLEEDGIAVMKQHLPQRDAAFFIDPPYTAAGKKAGARLYKFNELDHEALFDTCALCRGEFLMTYDNADGVLRMAEQRSFDTRLVAMKNTHHAEMTELLVARNLDWLQPAVRESQRVLFE